jgi:DNA-binding response OmpR family regulator
MSDHILLIEDDEALRHALSRELELAGYEVSQAPDYRDVLKLLESGKHISALVIDLHLPGVNGFALARMARMKHRGIKIIHITGADNVPLHEANGPVLRKPLAAEVLLTTIRKELAET